MAAKRATFLIRMNDDLTFIAACVGLEAKSREVGSKSGQAINPANNK
jgi:hypothetical protein